MNISMLNCNNCGTANAVAACGSCGKSFVITQAHLQHQPREFEAQAVSQVPEDFQLPLCDFCTAKAEGQLAQAVSAGLQQRTCPKCHTEFLSQHGS